MNDQPIICKVAPVVSLTFLTLVEIKPIAHWLLLQLIITMDMDIDVDPRISALSYRELQAKCKELGLSARGKTDVLRKNLNDYLNDPKETLKSRTRRACC
jgi:hypothetical protein